jgi:tetratricopeptide (TPR) repeat protein
MMHHNVHHQCATAEEVLCLESGFRTTASLLWRLLGNKIVTAALGLEYDSVQEMLQTATANCPGGGFRLIAENRPLWKWITQTVASAAQCALVPLDSLELDSLTHDENSRKIVIAMLIRDTLLVLTRVLLAMGGWRRCTSMPHALAYAETCCDLAKELEGGETRDKAASSMMSRLERLCTDAYATGLLELTSEYGEALLLHQESLQAAMNANDAVYEQRCHHHVGKALLRMQEFEIAKAEFTELLTLSQELGDTEMECLTQYELGEYCFQRGNLPQAQVHFKLALTLCNQAAHMGNTWRPQSVQRAIAFYAAMKPTRRGAIRIAPPVSRSAHRRATQFSCSQTAASVPIASNRDTDSACAVTNAPKVRRPAIRIEPPPLTNAQLESEGKPSFLQSLFLGESANFNAVDAITNSSNNDNSVASIGKIAVAASKLFPIAAASAPQLQKVAPMEMATRQPWRAAMSRRESVFTTAVPFSTALPVAPSASLAAASP